MLTSLNLDFRRTITACSVSTAILLEGSTATALITLRTDNIFLTYRSILDVNERSHNRRLTEAKGSPPIDWEEVLVFRNPAL